MTILLLKIISWLILDHFQVNLGQNWTTLHPSPQRHCIKAGQKSNALAKVSIFEFLWCIDRIIANWVKEKAKITGKCRWLKTGNLAKHVFAEKLSLSVRLNK